MCVCGCARAVCCEGGYVYTVAICVFVCAMCVRAHARLVVRPVLRGRVSASLQCVCVCVCNMRK